MNRFIATLATTAVAGMVVACSGTQGSSGQASAEAAGEPKVVSRVPSSTDEHDIENRLVARVTLPNGNIWTTYEPQPGIIIDSEQGPVRQEFMTAEFHRRCMSSAEIFAAVQPGIPLPEALEREHRHDCEPECRQGNRHAGFGSFGPFTSGGSDVNPATDDRYPSAVSPAWFSQHYGSMTYADYAFFENDYYTGYANGTSNAAIFEFCADTCYAADFFATVNICGGPFNHCGSSFQENLSTEYNTCRRVNFPNNSGESYQISIKFVGADGRYYADGVFGN